MNNRPHQTAFHRPVIRAGVMSPEAKELAPWGNSWAEARNVLLAAGFATYIYGLLVIMPAATIESEFQYGK